jgi:CHAT domain-containing protein
VWADLALRERRSPIGPSASALILGNPSYTPSAGEFYGPLPDAEREAQFVGRLFPSGQIMLGAAATPRAVNASLPQAELFHFAGHARFDGEAARLLLAGEGAVLDARAIEKSAGRCRLAVLSACSTAGERDGPWSIESLVQAFWRAGTPEVIASRWEVDSSVTARLIAEFYTHRLRGASGAESLRRAAATVRSLSGSTHPYYWAAFHVFGCLPMETDASH